MATMTLDQTAAGLQERLAAHMPGDATPSGVIVDALRQIAQLDGLPDDQLCWLAENGTEYRFSDGELLFLSEEQVNGMTILLTGEIHVRRHQTGPIVFFIGRSGRLTGKLPFSRMKTFGGDGYAAGDVWTLYIPESRFPEMLHAIPTFAQRCVSTLLDRAREVTRIEQQSEKLSALGKLAANLSHELNNPASAARSAANNLWTELRYYGDQKFRLGGLCMNGITKERYGEWVQSIRDLLSIGSTNGDYDSMALNTREDAFLQWLDAHGVEEGWKIAPTLAETRINICHLEQLSQILDVTALPVAISSFTSALKAERMTDAVMDSTRRIFDLISAIKDYSYMDQAPIQQVDLPQAIDSTLAMFTARLSNVDITRHYGPETPSILAYGSELNQVWTAIIENAIDAMDTLPPNEPRRLRIQIALSGPSVLIEFWDTGPGIEPDIQSRIFEPFFTTKPQGAGLGLGLDTANRVITKHRGLLTVQSKPGETCLQVRLPVEQTGAY